MTALIAAAVWATLSVLVVVVAVACRRWADRAAALREHAEALRRLEGALSGLRVRRVCRCRCGAGWLPDGGRWADGGVVHGRDVCQPVGEAL